MVGHHLGSMDTETLKAMEESEEFHKQMLDEATTKFLNVMSDDSAEFSALIDEYLRDYKKGTIGKENILSEVDLGEIGVQKTKKGKLYKNAAQTLAVNLRKNKPKPEDLGLENMLEKYNPPSSFGGKFDVFKEKKINPATGEEEQPIALNTKEFEKNNDYRKAMLDYVKELKKQLDKGYKLAETDS